MLLSNTTLKSLEYPYPVQFMGSDIVDAMSRNHSLRLEVLNMRLDAAGATALFRLLTPTSKLAMGPTPAAHSNATVTPALSHLRELKIRCCSGDAEALARMLALNTTLVELDLTRAAYSKEQWVAILPQLASNTILRTLCLDYCDGVDEDVVYKVLTDLLLANTTIQDISVYGTPLDGTGKREGKREALKEAIKRNVEYRSSLVGLPKVRSKSGRLVNELQEKEEEDPPALPADLQQLLYDLAGDALECLPILRDGEEEYGGYFNPFQGVGGSDEERRYWRVRMLVLTTIANCRSLVDIRVLRRWKIGLEREEEVLVLLRGLACNPVLHGLFVEGCEGFGKQAACVALGQLVASSRSLQEVSLRGVGLQAAGLGALAEGFNRGSVLEELNLGFNGVGDAEGAQHLARILATAPQLKRLRLQDIGMNVAGAQLIADALPQCAKLQFLEMGPGYGNGEEEDSSPSILGPVSTVLKRALTQVDDGNGSVPAAGITDLVLHIEQGGEAGLEDALPRMLRTNACVKRIQITPYALNHGLDALRHNSTIHELRFFGPSNRDETDVWMRLVPLLPQCKALRVLDLTPVYGAAPFKEALLRSLGHNTSLRKLKINGWDKLNDAMYRDLMSSLQVNTTLMTISIARTSWEMEGKSATINRALARNAAQQAYLPLLLEGQEPVMPKAGRLFLCGAPLAGKTALRSTMIRAWKELTAALPFHLGQAGLEEIMSCACIWDIISLCFPTDTTTEGIDIEQLRNDNDMQVTIWDLAGQVHYRALEKAGLSPRLCGPSPQAAREWRTALLAEP